MAHGAFTVGYKQHEGCVEKYGNGLRLKTVMLVAFIRECK